MEITDIFNRNNLIGDQDTSTINNFDDYLDSLLNPFNNILTAEILQLNDLKNSVQTIATIDNKLIIKLEIEDANIQNKYTFINALSDINTEAVDYIDSLTTTKASFTNILNSKAQTNSPLTRPTLRTVIDKDTTAITKGYVNNVITSYVLPTPIPNTKLYTNRTGTGFIWA